MCDRRLSDSNVKSFTVSLHSGIPIGCAILMYLEPTWVLERLIFRQPGPKRRIRYGITRRTSAQPVYMYNR